MEAQQEMFHCKWRHFISNVHHCHAWRKNDTHIWASTGYTLHL